MFSESLNTTTESYKTYNHEKEQQKTEEATSYHGLPQQINSPSKDRNCSIHSNENNLLTRVCLNNDPDRVKNIDSYTLFHDVIVKDLIDHVKQLITNGANINIADDQFKNTPLHLACIDGSCEMIKALIKNGSNLNIQNCDNETPAHSYINNHRNMDFYNNHLKEGTDKTLKNKDGLTAYELCLNNAESLKSRRDNRLNDTMKESHHLGNNMGCASNGRGIDKQTLDRMTTS